MADLKIDWATYESTKFACQNFHYSKSVPAGKLVRVGVWENNAFVGVVIFSYGANRNLATEFGLTQQEACELTRIALRGHETPVTRIVSIAIKMLKKKCPNIKLIISYADVDQGHEGVIYKAGNWIYLGLVNVNARGAFIIHGKKTHPKSIHSKYGSGSQTITWIRKNLDPNAQEFRTKGKHKYAYVLDSSVQATIDRKRV